LKNINILEEKEAMSYQYYQEQKAKELFKKK